MKKLFILCAIGLLAIVTAAGYMTYRQDVQQRHVAVEQEKLAAAALVRTKAARAAGAAAMAKSQAMATIPASFNKSALSNDAASSIWVVVNKLRSLQPKDYVPNDLVIPNIPLRLASTSSEMQLRQAASIALERMSAVANADGAHLMIASGYRSYALQVGVYGSEVKNYGQATADTESARPGFSEHQTGLAVDLEPTSRQCEVANCFANTVEGKWLSVNAWKYGFIQRYPPNKVEITGYRTEAWHFRYVGSDLTTELQKQHVTTLEEFFKLPAAANYAS